MQSRKLSLVKVSVASVSTAMILFVGIEDADAGSKKRTKRIKKHSHSHGHSHGHSHEESNWILGAGVSMSQGFGGSQSGGGGEEGGDHAGHSHLTDSGPALSLGEGHDHGGGGEEGAEGSSSGPEPTFSGLIGYRITKKMALNLNLGFGTTSGISDPVVGLDYSLPKIGKVKNSVITSFTVPASEASSKSYKETTLSLSWNPSLRQKKMLYSATVGLAKSYYSKTIIVEEEAASAKPLANKSQSGLLLQDDHDHDHDDEIEIEGEELGTGDREFDRYSTSANANYKISKSFLLGGGVGTALVTKQFGPSQIETSATLARVTWLWNSLSTTLSLGLSGSGESFTAPSNPTGSFSIFYNYE